jgi:predicted RNase H-like HicB family nuclease
MARKASVVIEKDEHGFYAWCPELKGCQSQGNTLEEAIGNVKEAIELYLETLPAADERDVPPPQPRDPHQLPSKANV